MNIPYGKQTIDEADISAVLNVLEENKYLTTGPLVSQFEDKVANFTNTKYAIAVNNGTSALHCAVKAIDIKEGDEVIVTALSFVASANCVLYEKGTPVFADIDLDTLNIDPDKIEKLINNKTKAIIVVHFTGQLCEMQKIKNIADKYNLKIIEDAAHAIGTKDICKYGDLATFSFHPVKNMTTGEGGMIITNNKDYYDIMKKFRSHGISKDFRERKSYEYDMVDIGYNFRITDIQCALGLSQLRKLPNFIKRRKEIALKYDKEFLPYKNFFTPLKRIKDNSYHIYVIKLNENLDRNKIYKKLIEKGIGVNVHYKPIYQHSYYKSLNIIGNCPVADKVYNQILTLPIYPTLTDKEQDFIIKSLIEIL